MEGRDMEDSTSFLKKTVDRLGERWQHMQVEVCVVIPRNSYMLLMRRARPCPLRFML